MHIWFIMDGNRRWAKSKLLPTAVWHREWVKNLEDLLWILPKYWVSIATVYALSTENLQRSKDELDALFKILEDFCDKKDLFIKNNIKVKIIWNLSLLPDKTKNKLEWLMDFTKDFKSFILQIAIAYGWKDEIIRAINKILNFKFWILNWDKNAEFLQQITEQDISNNLDTFWISDPDLIIRTWWHKRLSNFLMWQSAYSELYFTDTFWPAFDEKEFKKALDFYETQQRNFWK